MVDACLDDVDNDAQIDAFCEVYYCPSSLRTQMHQVCEAIAAADPLSPEPDPGACDGGTLYTESWVSPLGQTREFKVYEPCDLPPDPSVLIVFHHAGADADKILEVTRLDRQANDGPFLLVLPQGTPTGVYGQLWNDERGFSPYALVAYVNEVAFVAAMLSTVQSSYDANTDDAYVAGYTNGGGLALSLACRNSQLAAYGYQLSGFASIASSQPEVYLSAGACDSRSDAAVALFNGTGDGSAFWCNSEEATSHPEVCDNTLPEGNNRGGAMSSVLSTRLLWEQQLMCNPPQLEVSNSNPGDGTSLVTYRYPTCYNGSMRFYRIQNGGHTWPGTGVNVEWHGRTSQDIEASEALVEFFGLGS